MSTGLGTLLRPWLRRVGSSEEELVGRAQAGDVMAFEALYDMHVADVYAYVRLRVENDAVAEDLTQDTFVGAYRSLDRFEWRGALRPWLLRCAHNRVANHWRSVSRRPVTVGLEPGIEDDLALAALRNGRDPLERVADKLDHQAVERALGRLTDAQREVVALRFTLELSVAETAAVIGRTESAVKNLQHAALGAFRRALLAEDETE